MQTEHPFISGIQAETSSRPLPEAIEQIDNYGVEPGTELDIATAIVYLKAQARIKGFDFLPMEVQISNTPHSWIIAAKRFVKERKEEGYAGKRFDANA